jgi:hypothetical protein
LSSFGPFCAHFHLAWAMALAILPRPAAILRIAIMPKTLFAALTALFLSAPLAQAFTMPEDEDAAQFVTSNVIATFYHELGHALIDVLQFPVLGREEDAADALSAYLTHQIWEEDSAAVIVADSANAYLLYNAEAEEFGYETPYWDEHSLNLQRYYNLVCLFYGADPAARTDFVTEFELPENRAERCEAEYAQVDQAWGTLLQAAEYQEGAAGLVMLGDASDPIAAILAEEVSDFNGWYSLPTEVLVEIAPCGQANAFYYSGSSTITICTEYAEDLARIYETQYAK